MKNEDAPNPISRDPLEGLETEIAKGQSGEANHEEVVNLFLATRVYVPSGSDPTQDRDNFQPVVFDNDGEQFVAVFTALDRIPQDLAEMAPYAAVVTGANSIKMLGEGAGLVINPGNTLGFEIIPETVAGIQEYLASLPEESRQAFDDTTRGE